MINKGLIVRMYLLLLCCLYLFVGQAQTFTATKMKVQGAEMFETYDIKPLTITITDSSITSVSSNLKIIADAVDESIDEDNNRVLTFYVFESSVIQVTVRYDKDRNVSQVAILDLEGTKFTYTNNLMKA